MNFFLEAYDLQFCNIIVLTETWHINNNVINIGSYTMFYNDGEFNKIDGILKS